MKKPAKMVSLAVLVLLGIVGVYLWSQSSRAPDEPAVRESQEFDEIPVKGMPTMVDLGATECIPCKMMVPVMEKVEKKYREKAAIVFIDVWKNKGQAERFGIRAIPTQIFFNKEGKEVYRHEGFMGEEEIDRIFKKMGVS